MNKRFITVGVGSLAALALTAGPAMAHECFVVGQSTNGQASHSQVWFDASVTEFLGISGNCAVATNAYLESQGLLTSITIRSDKTIGENSANPNTGNGKGLEHAEDSPVTNEIIGAVFGFVGSHTGVGQACAV